MGGGAGTVAPNTNSAALFSLKNNSGTSKVYALTAICSGAGVSNCNPWQASATVAAGAQVFLGVNFHSLAGGTTGRVTFKASVAGVLADSAWVEITVSQPMSATVGPDGTAVAPGAFQTAFQVFTVTNGSQPGTVTVTPQCTGAGVNPECSASHGNMSMSAGQVQQVTVTYQPLAQGATGKVVLRATSGPLLDTGYVNVTVAAPTAAAPIIAVNAINPGIARPRDQCVAIAVGSSAASECGDLRITHALPTIRTMNKNRTPTLVYNSSFAAPRPQVAVVVSMPAGVPLPATFTGRMLLNGVVVGTGSWAGPEWLAGGARVVRMRDTVTNIATAVPSGAGVLNYTVDMTSVYTGGPVMTSSAQAVPVIVINRMGSPFGDGWWLAGFERLHVLGTDSVLWVGGDGSAKVYTRAPADPAGRLTSLKIDGADSIRLSGGVYTRYLLGGLQIKFDATGRHTSTVNRLGHTTTFLYNGSSKLETIRLPVAGGSQRDYTFIYSAGQYTISDNIRPAVLITLSGNKVQSIRDPDSQLVGFGYAPGSAVITQRTNRRQVPTLFTLDSLRKVVRSQVSPTAAPVDDIILNLKPAESRGFTGTGSVDTSKATTWIDGPRASPVIDTTTFRINRFGAPTVIVNALGQTTTLTYDATWAGLVSGTVKPTGQSLQAVYSGTTGLVQSVTDLSWLNATTSYTYGAKDQVQTMTTPGNGTVTFTLNPGNGNRNNIQDVRGVASQVNIGYDGYGQVNSLSGGGTLAQTFRNDNQGNLDQMKTAKNFTTNITNDNIGRPWRTIAPVDTLSTKFTTRTIGYDFMSRVKGDTLISTNGTERTIVLQSYDPEGNLLNVNRTFSPDQYGIGAQINSFTYDSANRQTTETFPGGRRNRVSYDPAGNVVRDSTRRGLVDTMTYDPLNRLWKRMSPGVTYASEEIGFPAFEHIAWSGYGIAADTAVYTYAPDGQVATANNKYARITRIYKPNGLLESELLAIREVFDSTAFSHSYLVQSAYDTAGRRTALTPPTALTAGAPFNNIRFTYLPIVGLEHVYDLFNNDMRYDYKSWGAPAHLYRPGGISETWDYDIDGNLTSDGITNGSTAPLRYPQNTLRSTTFRYDGRGKVLTAVDPNGFQDVFGATYSDLGYLQTSNLEQKSIVLVGPGSPPTPSRYHSVEGYTTDGLGNVVSGMLRDSTFVGGMTTLWKAESSNRASVFEVGTGRLKAIGVAPGVRSFTHDLAGNTRTTLLSGIGAPADATTSYYDSNGRIRATEGLWKSQTTEFTGAGPTKYLALEEYRYDALGRRILVRSQRSCVNISLLDNQAECWISIVRRTIWDGDQELAEITMPDTPAYRENDTATMSMKLLQDSVGATGDPNPFYGRVVYAFGLQIDQPLSITRFGYADRLAGAPVTNWNPFVILPLWNTRGQAPMGVFSNGAASWQLQAGGTSCGTGLQRCVIGAWPDGWAAYDSRRGLAPFSWHGTLLENKRDKSGLEYKRNRVYDPQAGRFTQEDPIGLAGGLNAYGFANSDPVNMSDPFGLSPIGKIIKLLVRGFKVVERDVEFRRAVEAVRAGEDFLAQNRRIAKDVAREAGGGKSPIGPELSKGEGSRPHYHTADRSGGHVFYSIAAGLTFSHYTQGGSTALRVAGEIADFFNPLSLPQDLIEIKQLLIPVKDQRDKDKKGK